MSNQNLQTLKGFRDFLPVEKRQRDFVAKKVIEVFEKFGFEPLETPTLEAADLLLGKYGTEADKLVYTFVDRGERRVGLRYDQTVPTARVLAQYQNELPKFWRRYQIQNVFRADKPQKGRYREFTQCDCDIFGSDSPLADAEILAVFNAVYQNLGFKNLTIQINDRQTLIATLGKFANSKVDVASIIQSIDKLDKQTSDQVMAELIAKGLDEATSKQVLFSLEKAEMSNNLCQIVQFATNLGVPEKSLVFNPKLARGLDYYTGLIFEGRISEYAVGSIGGGGRYDNLVENLSGLKMSAVGFGIGFDRTVEAAIAMGLVSTANSSSQVLVTVFSEALTDAALSAANKLRLSGIKTEVYPSASDKIAKQLKLADQKKIPFVIIIGEEEAKKNQVTLKNLSSGEQITTGLDEAIKVIIG